MSVLEAVKSVSADIDKKQFGNATKQLNLLQSKVRVPAELKSFADAEVVTRLANILERNKTVPPIQMPIVIIFMALSMNTGYNSLVGENGGVIALVTTVSETDQPIVVQHGTGAIRNLLSNEANRSILSADESSVAKLVKLLGKSVRDANKEVGSAIADNLCCALGLLAKSEEVSEQLGTKYQVIPIISDLFELPIKPELYTTLGANALRLVQFMAYTSDDNPQRFANSTIIVNQVREFSKHNSDALVKLANNVLQMLPNQEASEPDEIDTEEAYSNLTNLETIVNNLGSRERRAGALGVLLSFVENKPNNIKIVLDYELDIFGALIELMINLHPTSNEQDQTFENLCGCILEMSKSPLAMSILQEHTNEFVPALISKCLEHCIAPDSSIRYVHTLINALALTGFLTINKKIKNVLLNSGLLDVYQTLYNTLLPNCKDRDHSQALGFIVKTYINLTDDENVSVMMLESGIVDALIAVVMNQENLFTQITKRDACTALWNFTNYEVPRDHIHSKDCYQVMSDMLESIQLASHSAGLSQEQLNMSEESLSKALLQRRKREDVEKLQKILREREEELEAEEDEYFSEDELDPEMEEVEPEEEEIAPEDELVPEELELEPEELEPADELEPSEDFELSAETQPKKAPQKIILTEDGKLHSDTLEVEPTEDLNDEEYEEMKRKRAERTQREEEKRRAHEIKVKARREQKNKERQLKKDQESLDVERRNKKASKRRMICMELLQTEDAYVKGLGKVETLYMNPLSSSANSGLLPDDKFKTIFGDIRIIHKINQDFFRELSGLYEKPDFWGKEEQYLGSFFLRRMNTFKLYTNFVNGYAASEACLHETVRKNRKFGEFLDAISDVLVEERSRQTDLASFLISPIQRLPRYSLLLTDLIRNSDYPDTHSAYLLLENALIEVQNITTFVNEGKRSNEQVVQARELIKKLNLSKQLGDSKRALIRSEKEFSYVTYDKYKPNGTRSKPFKCKVHVFDDVIVIAREGIVTKQVVLPLIDCKVKNKVADKDRTGQCFTIEDEQQIAKAQHQIHQSQKGDGIVEEIVYEINCNTQSQRNDMISNLRNLIEDLKFKKKKIIRM
ncbi:hypothetical protein AKO1_011135 [Acrasis kona]|uniref:DH domain-containing protein n=1 Tax=Acrasis kona TaxID=1008807 RepID=A0AAW2YZM7_9EUKA